jgi:hypothetical protein
VFSSNFIRAAMLSYPSIRACIKKQFCAYGRTKKAKPLASLLSVQSRSELSISKHYPF